MAWEQDYHMQDPGRLALFDEYLEMSKYSFCDISKVGMLLYSNFSSY